MKKFKNALSLAVAFTGVALVTGCSEEALDPTGNLANEYVKSFIEKYGVPEAGHNFSMAKLGSVTVRTDRPTDIRIVSTVEGKNYEFDSAYGVDGEKTLTFDIPRDVNYVSVIANNNRAYTVALGGVVTIGTPRQSRANEGTETAITVTNDNSDAVEYTPNSDTDGKLWADNYNTELFSFENKSGTTYYMLGSELKQYVSETNKSIKDVTNEEYTSRHVNQHISVLNLRATGTQAIEVGRVYGDQPYLKDSHHFTLVPELLNDEKHRSGNVGELLAVNDLHKWGHDLTIDYNATSAHSNGADGANKGVISSSVLGVKDFAEYRNILADATLKSDLEKYANAQQTYNMPVLTEMHDGDSQFGVAAPLDPYDVNDPLKFYQQWNDYINAWINAQGDAVKSQFPDLTLVKEFMATRGIYFKKGARPSVIKEGEGKYKIEFYDSQLSGSSGSSELDLSNETFNRFDEAKIYSIGSTHRCSKVGEENNADKLGTEFAYYIRDLNDENGTIITTTDKSRVKTTYRHLSGTTYNGVHSEGEVQIFMVDFDGDEIYNDFVFIPQLVVYGNGGYFRWRLAAEDLGSTDDNDFNDLVVDVTVDRDGNDAQRILVTPRAAGGIYPLYLMFNDTKGNTFFVGQEIHEWFDQQPGAVYNTGDVDMHKYGGTQAEIAYDLNEQTGEYNISNVKEVNNGTLGGFWVLVDKNGTLDGKVTLDKRTTTLMTAEIKALIEGDKDIYKVNNDPKNGVNDAIVPQMILVTNSWLWPQEKVDISQAYAKFPDWVADRNAVWFGGLAEGVDATQVTQERKD